MEDIAVYQAVAIIAFGMICFGLGYAIRAVISLHRRTKAMGDRLVILSDQSIRLAPVRESAEEQPQAEETRPA